MKDQLDPVESALESLKSRHWPGGHNSQLKDKLMREYQMKRSFSGPGRRGALIATLAILVLATAGFAAAGGVELIRGWFITVEIDGQIVDIDDADITVETEGDTVTLSLDLGNIDSHVEEGATATITAIAREVEIDGESDGEAPSSPRTLMVRTAIANEAKPDGESDDEAAAEPLILTVPVDTGTPENR